MHIQRKEEEYKDALVTIVNEENNNSTADALCGTKVGIQIHHPDDYHTTCHRINNVLLFPLPSSSPHPLLMIDNLQSNRRHSIQHPRHLIRRHLRALQTPHLASLPQSLQPKGQFPALGFVNEEDVFLAVGIADRSAEDVQVFGGLFARLFYKLAFHAFKTVGERKSKRKGAM